MALCKLDIIGYRGFSEQTSVTFALPNGEEASGLTILTGPNNSGKSSILECLRARSGARHVIGPSFSSGIRNTATDSVKITYSFHDHIEVLESVRRGTSETRLSGHEANTDIYVLPARRAFHPFFSKAETSRKDYITNAAAPSQREPVLPRFHSRLFAAQNRESFNAVLSEALGYLPEWTIDQTDQGSHYLKFNNGGSSHSSDGMGEGIVNVFTIVDALHDSKPGDTIVIDEPELSLHPSLQKRIDALLRRFSSDRQIVISTHSPYFVDIRDLSKGARLMRVVSGSDGSRVHEMSEDSAKAALKLAAGNYFNPHVFGLDARELFFQEDKIILVEGQEDVLFLPMACRQVGKELAGHLFGWGVGGADNMPHLCRILLDLGFTQVAGILDGDKAELRSKLERDFPVFHFECISAKDIRTKPARKARGAVDGLLDDSMHLRPNHQSEFSLLVDRVNGYFCKRSPVG